MRLTVVSSAVLANGPGGPAPFLDNAVLYRGIGVTEILLARPVGTTPFVVLLLLLRLLRGVVRLTVR